ncbi:Tyrosine-protein kinase receptor UFO [Chelonia mydas]|uniref:receptor protein-tyrosine kinase n=1 Tax=Chelonia mydas TaxID=8469 RepID=M7AZQ5_CHEMY|nr:Tyrosine-protein kinase receptor UFO [Chelonia mydas]
MQLLSRKTSGADVISCAEPPGSGKANMGKARSSLLCVLVACWMGSGTPADLHFLESPSNQTSSLGKDVRLRCAVQLSQELPEISWRRDGQALELADSNQMQMPINDTVWLAISELSIPSVQLSDAGSYQCAMWVNGEEVLSDTAHLGLEGLPFFSEEPQDLEVAADTPFNLSCSAQGPPEPVRVIWLQDGAPLNSLVDPMAQAPSMLAVSARHPGKMKLRRGREFPWRDGCPTLLPFGPRAMGMGLRNLLPPLPWGWGRGLGLAQQRMQIGAQFWGGVGGSWPPHCCESLVLCSLELPSSAPPRMGLRGPGAPRGLQGGLKRNPDSCRQGWGHPRQGPPPLMVVVDVGLTTEKTLELVSEVQNLTVRVASYTSAGDGPWSDSVMVSPSLRENATPAFSWHWWAVILAVGLAVAFAVFFVLILARLRKKETRFGARHDGALISVGVWAVPGTMGPDLGRVNSLGISEDLKEKLRDVMVDRHKVALGKTLGEGEFGSVMEGQLNQDDSVLKVAVKTMKIAICTRSEMEDFLSEAVCMKEFDHPNVMKLLAHASAHALLPQWSFGVTMWEIATRGQTPYPGVENSEIYDYLRQGHRLKQPLDCLDAL